VARYGSVRAGEARRGEAIGSRVNLDVRICPLTSASGWLLSAPRSDCYGFQISGLGRRRRVRRLKRRCAHRPGRAGPDRAGGGPALRLSTTLTPFLLDSLKIYFTIATVSPILVLSAARLVSFLSLGLPLSN